MSESWWGHPSGVQSVLRKEIKIRDDRIEELEAKLAKAVRFLNGLDRHGVYTTDELEDLLEELKGQYDEQNHQAQIPYWLDSYCRPNKTKGD